jgi:hypothetical protein
MSERRIATRFLVTATLEEGKLGALHVCHDDATGAPALVLVTGDRPDDVLQAIVDDNAKLAGCPDVLLTYAYGHDGDKAWLATECEGGHLLDEAVQRKDKVDLVHVLRVGLGLARALTAAHDAGVQHLDLGPHRVWLAGAGPIGDGAGRATRAFGFGWHRLLAAYHQGAGADAFYGNPEFMPAEVCKAMAPGATADVYSGALVLWALTAGKAPFKSSQPLMTLKRQAVEKPLRLDLVKPAWKGVKDLQTWLGDALDKDPVRRPQPAAWFEVGVALASAHAPEVVEAVPEAPDGRDARLTGVAAIAAHAAEEQAAHQAAAERAREEAAAAERAAQAKAEATAAAAKAANEKREQAEREAEAQKKAATAHTLAPHHEPAIDGEDATRIQQAIVLPEDDDDKAGGRDRRGKRGKQAKKEEPKKAAPSAPAKVEPSKPAAKPESGKVEAAKADAKPALPQQPSIIVKPASGQLDPALYKRPMTERTMRVEMAESAFFTEEAHKVGTALHEQAPPVPSAAKVSKPVLAAIGLFAATMVGVTVWILMNHEPPKPVEGAENTGEAAAEASAEPAPVASAAEAVPAPAAPAAEPVAAPPAAVPAPAVAAAAAALVPEAIAPAADAAPAPDPAATDVQKLVDEGMALLGKDPRAAMAKAEQALALNAGHAPAERLKKEAQADIDRLAEQERVRAAEERVKAEAEAAAQAKAATERAAQEQAAADKARKEAEAKAAQELAAQEKAQKAAAAKEAAAKAAEAKAAKDAAARDAAQKAAQDKAQKAAQEKAAKDAAAKAAADKADKDKAQKAAAARPAPGAPPPAPALARPAEATPPRPPAAPGDGGSAESQEASKMASLAQKAAKAKLKVLYLQRAVKLDPGNPTYRNLLKIAEAELAAENPQ